ncbi:MAG TPA: N-acetyltransferase [bacterium]|nr:N-acetyltransferase [bacterium]
MITVRPENPQDITRVRQINESAFETLAEAYIVDAVRRDCPDAISLVAEDAGAVVGQILFSPAAIESAGRNVVGMGLGPVAVLPERQRQGIGSKLISRGLEILRERGCPFVVVLGYPEYYSRFGFERASQHGLSCQWEGVPDDIFLVMVTDPAAMKGVSGAIRYRDEFDAAMY